MKEKEDDKKEVGAAAGCWLPGLLTENLPCKLSCALYAGETNTLKISCKNF